MTNAARTRKKIWNWNRHFSLIVVYVTVGVVCSMHRAPVAIKITMFHDKQFVEIKCFNNDTLNDFSSSTAIYSLFWMQLEKSARENVAFVEWRSFYLKIFNMQRIIVWSRFPVTATITHFILTISAKVYFVPDLLINFLNFRRAFCLLSLTFPFRFIYLALLTLLLYQTTYSL